MPAGVMKRWHADKGFGFISPDQGGEDVFCHVTALLDGEGSVQEGDQVRFQVRYDDRKGKDRAEKVELASGGGGGGRGGRSRSPPPRGRSPPRGGGFGGGGGGEVRPGDWACPGCGANVFASKSECFKCGEPKPRGGRDDDRRGGGGRDRDYDDRRGGRDDRRDDRRGGRDDRDRRY